MKGISPRYFECYPWLQRDWRKIEQDEISSSKIPHLLVVLCGSIPTPRKGWDFPEGITLKGYSASITNECYWQRGTFSLPFMLVHAEYNHYKKQRHGIKWQRQLIAAHNGNAFRENSHVVVGNCYYAHSARYPGRLLPMMVYRGRLHPKRRTF